MVVGWDHSCSSEAGLCLKCEVYFLFSFFFSFLGDDAVNKMYVQYLRDFG